VSTTKQGERSVSLPEQKNAIERYAIRSGLTITRWFEEQQTAAKQGRPVWNGMLRELRKGSARGVIIHKIDRSARNLKDWADLGELIDQGVVVHFANETIDLHSRGGRLSADIQAVVAADYIRNLREETKKGIYGRLKQGFYPLRAPVGYLDNGAAKAKTIDPQRGPLVRQAFELYGTGQWSIPTLVDEVYRRGLRNHAGGRVTRTGLHTILRNPFYTGIIRIRASGQTYEGNHQALISKSLFDRVQDILHGRIGTRINVHDFLFRRFIRCTSCGHSLIGELQKGWVYYRCHTKECRGVSVREDAVAVSIERGLQSLEFSELEKQHFAARIAELNASWTVNREKEIRNLHVRIEQISERLNRAADAYLEGVLDQSMFEGRKAELIAEQRALRDRKSDLEANRVSTPSEIEKYVELARSAYLLYRNATIEKKRRLLRTVVSNCTITRKNVHIAWQIPFLQIAEREKSTDSTPSKEMSRTSKALIDRLFGYFANSPELDLSILD